jgi:hypothetical protein
MPQFHALLRPYEPTAADPFDAVKAAHLLNRAGFGGTPDEIKKVLELGPAKAVDWLMSFPDQGAAEQDPNDVPDLSAIADGPKTTRDVITAYLDRTPAERAIYLIRLVVTNARAMASVGEWWVKRLAYGRHPLQEKLTFFWHGHFTTSARDELNARMVWNQNELQRRMAAGNFKAFVKAISRDPAMLDYLNNQQNRKGHPNENYARELMELFTMGEGSGYTEHDIKEAARAFTGWQHDGPVYRFNPLQHDFEAKTVLGKTGRFNGDDVVDLIFAHPACSRFIASKLFRHFAYADVEPELAQSLGELFKLADFKLRPLLRTILRSRAFYSSRAIGSQIKSPVQLLVGSIRLLDLQLPHIERMRKALEMMGQVPFYPPNVKGWPGGRAWINATTLLVRYNSAAALASGKYPGRGTATPPEWMPEPGTSPESIVDAWLARLVQRPIDPAKRQTLIDALGQGTPGESDIRKVVQLIVSSPEYQLC